MLKSELETKVRSIVLSPLPIRGQYGELCNLLADYFADTSCNPPSLAEQLADCIPCSDPSVRKEMGEMAAGYVRGLFLSHGITLKED